MTAFSKKVLFTGVVAVAGVLASASVAFAAPLIPAGAGWADFHGSNPGYCLNCHTGFAAGAAPAIVAGTPATHRDRGSTCTQCHTVTTLPPADTTAPVTTSDAKAAYTGSATIKLSATDAGTGVAATHYKLDTGADTVGTTVSTSAVGSHTLEFWSVDKAGNVETHKKVTFTVAAVTPPPAPADTVAPATTSDAKASYVATATIKLTATDAGTGVAATHYRLDAGSDTVGTTVTTSVVGTHTVEFWSVDKAGNVEAHHTVTFAVTQAPVVQPPVVTPPTAGGDDVRPDGDHRDDREHRHHRRGRRSSDRFEWFRLAYSRLHLED